MVHKNVPDVIPLASLNNETPQVIFFLCLLETNPHEPTLLTYLFAFKATVENEKHLAKRREEMEKVRNICFVVLFQQTKG
jgi:hypothetical protein